MSVICYCATGVMDLSGVFCVADSGVLQDTFLWNSLGMHTCSVWLSNTLMQGSELAAKTELRWIANVVPCHHRAYQTVTYQFQK